MIIVLLLNYIKSYLVNFPDDNEVQYKLAQILMWQNNLCEAADVAENLVQKESNKIEYLLLAAKINFWLEKDLTYSQSLIKKFYQLNHQILRLCLGWEIY